MHINNAKCTIQILYVTVYQDLYLNQSITLLNTYLHWSAAEKSGLGV